MTRYWATYWRTRGKTFGKTEKVAQYQQLSLTDWHKRYKQQASWSEDVRRYLFSKAEIKSEEKILEVGSGTGAVLSVLSDETNGLLFGIDIDISSLLFSAKRHPHILHTAADGFNLPFTKDSFLVTYCHYFLLWIQDPLQILHEMMRVTKPGGYVLALAEPDYQARIDFPQPLDTLGQKQTDSLKEQGVDPAMGRKLAGLFHEAGLNEITVGILGAQWNMGQSHKVDEQEWMMIQMDLSGKLTHEILENYQQEEIMAKKKGERILFIPTFYAAGIVA